MLDLDIKEGDLFHLPYGERHRRRIRNEFTGKLQSALEGAGYEYRRAAPVQPRAKPRIAPTTEVSPSRPAPKGKVGLVGIRGPAAREWMLIQRLAPKLTAEAGIQIALDAAREIFGDDYSTHVRPSKVPEDPAERAVGLVRPLTKAELAELRRLRARIRLR